MNFVLRAASPADLEAIYAMAKSTGGGFTNLPPDRAVLAEKLERAGASFAREEDTLADDRFIFMLEAVETGQLRGTCQIFSQIGAVWPFYSYRIGVLTQTSKELGRTFRAETLTLSSDLDGSSEVGGLYLHPLERASGAGALLARSRYLFIRMHRPRFAERTIAELRGSIDEAGNSAFWDGLAGRFFGMGFREADEFNATHGNQFIADLMPKTPIYTAMLPESAVAVMGVPHVSGRAAMRMLEKEGFHYENYVDIFDGGPTVTCPTDDITTVRDAREAEVTAVAPADAMPDGRMCIVSTGRLGEFRATYAQVAERDGGAAVEAAAAARLGVKPYDNITYISR